VANQVKQMAVKQLHSESGISDKFIDRYKLTIDSLDFDLSGLGSECLPCNDTMNITYSSV
jgi:hypothetical protein